ncbi:type II toxin-antitoxin system PemK/MazF family toxin [bacterium]|nr:type II toxin-antitoxin system PemK/MazF family toxin [bacterium]
MGRSIFNPGEIYIVNFSDKERVGGELKDPHPCIVLSHPDPLTKTVVTVPITSWHPKFESNALMKKRYLKLSPTISNQLSHDSAVALPRVRELDLEIRNEDYPIKKVGTVDPFDMERILRGLAIFLMMGFPRK